MIKFVYFSYIFSAVTLIIFFQSWRFDFINRLIYGLSLFVNLISIYLLIRFRNKLNRFWLTLNIIINISIVIGMSYLAIMYFLLLDA